MINQNTECCPKFNSTPWDDKVFNWDNKRFIKSKVFSLFYIPINFGSAVRKLMAKIENAGVQNQDRMGLSDHTSKWNMDLYVAVDREIPNAENVTLNGKFYSKVYEGNFKETEKWCKDFDIISKNKGFRIKKRYMWYTTCPKCAKKYGNNYVVIFGQIE